MSPISITTPLPISNRFSAFSCDDDNETEPKCSKIYLSSSWEIYEFEVQAVHATAPHRRTAAQRKLRKSSANQCVFTEDAPPCEPSAQPEEHKSFLQATRFNVQSDAYPMFEQFGQYLSDIKIPTGSSAAMKTWFHTNMRHQGDSLIGKYADLNPTMDNLCNKVESIGIFWYLTVRARNATDRYVALATFAKLMNTGINEYALGFTAAQQAYDYFCPKEEMQVQSDTLPIFDTMRSFLDKFEIIKQSPFFAKLYKFSMYSLALSLFKPAGIDMDYLKFDKIAQEGIKKKFHLGPDFVHCVLDTVLFLSERGYQSYQAGSIMPMFHSEAKYQEWYDKAEKLNRQSQFLSNPEVHGIDRFAYLSDLKDVIEKGHCMRKCTTQKDEKLIITKLLANLELTHDLELTKRAAQADRKSPLCILLYGGSGIGKSTLQNVFFQHYGKRRNRKTTPEYRYVRNPTDPYWSGMNSTQWCIILDDIAFLAPQMGVLDPTLAEMLCIANNVPFVPNQAELADKGRTPVRAELVLGSTNTEDLNSFAYFSCPLAVQRRFPYVVDITVKPEFQNVERPGMLDSSKVPETTVGSYPDFWHFHVKRVEPAGTDRKNQRGKLETVKKMTSMRELLVWYNKVIDDHNAIQDKIEVGTKSMTDTVLCDSCSMPSTWCTCLAVQSATIEGESEDDPPIESASEVAASMGLETPPTTLVMYTPPAYFEAPVAQEVWSWPLLDYLATFDTVTWIIVIWYASIRFFWVDTYISFIPILMFGDGWYGRLLLRSKFKLRLLRVAVGVAGRNVETGLGGGNKMRNLALAVGSCIVAYKTVSVLRGFFGSPKVQGGAPSNLTSIGKAPTPDINYVEKPSYADPYPFTNQDLSQTTLCTKGQDGKLITQHIEAATCVFHSHYEGVTRVTTAVNVRGATYMVNNHGIPTQFPFFLDVTCEKKGTLSGSMKGLKITASMVHRIPERDLAFVKLRCRPPATDITQYFCKKNYVGLLDGRYIGRDVTGKLWHKEVQNIKLGSYTWKSHTVNVKQDCWSGTVASPTSVGDCGSLLLSNTPKGWAILGIHTLGDDHQKVMAMKVDLETVVEACDTLESEYCSRGQVQVSAPSKTRNLGDLSSQSVIKSANNGVANVIGSFTGEFRQRSKSNVAATFLAPFLVKYGYEMTRAKPDMTKRPWVHALNDTTRPVVLMDNDILDTARDSFIQETTMDDVRAVHVYPLDVAINGCPGLMYCDKMNRKSSAGAPYKKSKSHFMHFIDEHVSTDMDVSDEIKETVADMIATYQRGERVHTIYCGHLKDEPVTHEKCASGKTRVFTASGMAYTLVVRMYLLSSIVFMQKNRFVYETGPGTVAQSLEWEEIREHLVQHGEDRIVAGDYSKFDKRMPANVILAAFDILYNLCERAGYSKDELMVVRGIAYDTAFPTVDFNGDLIEFYGSNPSGHPLTVIVNGLANSLYMRYCYIVLRPLGDTTPFRSNVALMTYGDDNIMGVSARAPWFNHTAIQKTLAWVDIGYTMADKEAESVPYIHINDANFLKRTWRWDAEVGAYVAPLDLSSIEKMLMICVPKNNVTERHHAIQVLGTAVREYFWYGREIYETSVVKFQKVVEEANLELYVEASTFPSWEELHEDFWSRSKHVTLKRSPLQRD